MALIIFILVYLGIIFNRLPFVNLDRKSFAFIGAVLMILAGEISPKEAVDSIDFNTLSLLLGMMLIISNLRLEGFFSLLSQKTTSCAKTPLMLLSIVVFITGFASAFLVNDAVVLLFTPVIIEVCKKLDLPSIPFLLGEIFSANAGSLMTITGNPQNMIIGIASNISYSQFMLYLLPIALLSMVVIIVIIRIFYKKTFYKKTLTLSKTNHTGEIKNMRLSLLVFALVIIGFFFGKIFGLSIPMIALIGGVLTLILSKHKADKIFEGVDWSLLLFFASLFVLVASIKNSNLLSFVFNLHLEESPLSILI
ncbi:MAG: SLC13 family permease, partial [Bacteroidota bacterium]|nr:SLC13 family permease [Bacteroidota bacterium]